jgi:hypothetical protein
MNLALVLGMFPGFKFMIAVYFTLKAVGLTQNLWTLVIQYSADAGLGFHIAKGFFDTIPRSLDEAARMDGATNAQVFLRVIMPITWERENATVSFLLTDRFRNGNTSNDHAYGRSPDQNGKTDRVIAAFAEANRQERRNPVGRETLRLSPGRPPVRHVPVGAFPRRRTG